MNRGLGVAGVWDKAVPAGTIASTNGKANVTPAPRTKVRRGICFLLINIALSPKSMGNLKLDKSPSQIRNQKLQIGLPKARRHRFDGAQTGQSDLRFRNFGFEMGFCP